MGVFTHSRNKSMPQLFRRIAPFVSLFMIQPLSGDGIGEAGEEEAEKTGILPSLGRSDLLEKGNADPKKENSATGSPQGGEDPGQPTETDQGYGKWSPPQFRSDCPSSACSGTFRRGTCHGRCGALVVSDRSDDQPTLHRP